MRWSRSRRSGEQLRINGEKAGGDAGLFASVEEAAAEADAPKGKAATVETGSVPAEPIEAARPVVAVAERPIAEAIAKSAETEPAIPVAEAAIPVAEMAVAEAVAKAEAATPKASSPKPWTSKPSSPEAPPAEAAPASAAKSIKGE